MGVHVQPDVVRMGGEPLAQRGTINGDFIDRFTLVHGLAGGVAGYIGVNLTMALVKGKL